jgi:hypothetical protein
VLTVYQEHENVAGGMSYKTFGGIDNPKILRYLDGMDKHSSNEVFKKNKAYYIASADKTRARLLLTKKRVDVGYLISEERILLNKKIADSIRWLENLKSDIRNAEDNSEFNTLKLYKKWHAIKLIPSAVEGILLTSLIGINIENFESQSSFRLPVDITNLNEDAARIFNELLNLTENSDFKEAERLRIEGFNKTINAAKKLLKYTKIS